MATIFEMTGDDREDRIAELKRKMQENAKRVKADQNEQQQSEEVPASAAVATAEAPAAVATAEAPTAVATADAPAGNGTVAAPTPATRPAATASSATVAAVAPTTTTADDEEASRQAALTRREFLTYAWGAAMALLAVETGLASYFFMYPRFRAGEFGGAFYLPATDVPALDAAPVPETAGKFWLVNTEDEGPKALYMVCTHLGCLYKWQASNNRFECPCHGSKFSKAGYYIEGPAPRSLDRFELTAEGDQLTIDTGAKITGNPSSESPARVVAA